MTDTNYASNQSSKKNSNEQQQIKTIENLINTDVDLITENINKAVDEKLNHLKQIKNCTKILKLMFSNVGLCVLMLLFLSGGSVVFMFLERTEEHRLCDIGKGKYLNELKSTNEHIMNHIIYNSSRVVRCNSNSRVIHFKNSKKKTKHFYFNFFF
jgi:hypothetical protein